jgi:hypothetical protein
MLFVRSLKWAAINLGMESVDERGSEGRAMWIMGRQDLRPAPREFYLIACTPLFLEALFCSCLQPE